MNSVLGMSDGKKVFHSRHYYAILKLERTGGHGKRFRWCDASYPQVILCQMLIVCVKYHKVQTGFLKAGEPLLNLN